MIWTFASAIFLMLITPGPGVMTAAGVGAAFGFRPGLRYLVGLCLGSNLVGFAVISGLAALVLAEPAIRTALLACSCGYLLYLASQILRASGALGFTPATRQPGIGDGILLQVLNPKAYVVNTVIFAGFALWPEAYVREILVKLLIVNAIWVPIHLLWLGAGVQIKRLDLAPGTQSRINIGMAAALTVVAVIAFVSGFAV